MRRSEWAHVGPQKQRSQSGNGLAKINNHAAEVWITLAIRPQVMCGLWPFKCTFFWFHTPLPSSSYTQCAVQWFLMLKFSLTSPPLMATDSALPSPYNTNWAAPFLLINTCCRALRQQAVESWSHFWPHKKYTTVTELSCDQHLF